MDACLIQLTNSINYSIQHNSFPLELKLSKVIPLYKKLNSLQKKKNRPGSLLPHTSNVFDRIIHKRITNYMRDKLNKSITGFRKSLGTQNSLVVMLEKWKRAIDKGECVSALFMDLSRTVDTINHDLTIAKLKAYDFSGEALRFMQSYLKSRKQRVQTNNKFSFEKDVIAGVPQGSIDGLLVTTGLGWFHHIDQIALGFFFSFRRSTLNLAKLSAALAGKPSLFVFKKRLVSYHPLWLRPSWSLNSWYISPLS